MGKNWVFVRGLARHSAHWGPFKDLIQRALPEDHFEFLDARGNGEQNDQKSFTSISGFVDDLRLRSHFVPEKKKVSIVGISMGAMMAVDWVTRFREEVDRVVCINTSDAGTAPFWKRLRPQSYGPLAQILLNNSDAIKREELSLDLITNLLPNKIEVARDFSKLKVTTRENFFRQIFAASQFRFPKLAPPRPCLLICSDGDRLASSECTKRIARMWGLVPVVHVEAGHDLPLDAPQWLADQIVKFANT